MVVEEGNSLHIQGSGTCEHGNMKTHSLLPLPFTANSSSVTFSSELPGMFHWCDKGSRGSHQGFVLHPWLLGAPLVLDVLWTQKS